MNFITHQEIFCGYATRLYSVFNITVKPLLTYTSSMQYTIDFGRTETEIYTKIDLS